MILFHQDSITQRISEVDASQVQRTRKIGGDVRYLRDQNSAGMSHPEESTGSATFRCQCIDGDSLRIQTARMLHVILATPERSFVQNID